MTRVEILRAEVAAAKREAGNAKKAATVAAKYAKEVQAHLVSAQRRLVDAEIEAQKWAAIARKRDAQDIGGVWVADLHRDGPKKVVGRVLRFVPAAGGWMWDDATTSLMPLAGTAAYQAELLNAAGDWRG